MAQPRFLWSVTIVKSLMVLVAVVVATAAEGVREVMRTRGVTHIKMLVAAEAPHWLQL